MACDLPEVGGPMKILYALIGNVVPNDSIVHSVLEINAVVVMMHDIKYPRFVLRDFA